MPRTRQHNANLDKLATYLEQLPKDYEHFAMETYYRHIPSDGEHKHEEGPLNPNTCGTVACAVGHGLAAGVIPTDERLFDWLKQGFGWSEYTDVCFTPDYTEDVWCFGGSWPEHDDTPRGAAARIRYMLDRGVPEGFGAPNEHYVSMYQGYLVS